MTTTSDRDDAGESAFLPKTHSGNQPREKPVWTSDQIMQGRREVLIQHGTETYRLMLTKANKLILQK